MTQSRRNRLLLVLSGAGIALISWLGPHIVPLYDGIGFPDEPYRYVDQSTETSLAPTNAQQTIPLVGINDSVIPIATGESGPQLTINLTASALSAPKPAQDVIVRAEAQAPSTKPDQGNIAGNVYHVTATSDPGPPTIDNSEVSISLRLPQGSPTSPTPVVEYRTATGAWKPQVTIQVGNDIYEAHFAGVGDYAMVTGTAPTASPAKTSGSRIWLAAASFVVALAITAILAVRLFGTKNK